MEQSSTNKCVDDAASVAAAAINGEREASRREALVAMVQSTDFRNGDHFAAGWRFYWTGLRTIVNPGVKLHQ